MSEIEATDNNAQEPSSRQLVLFLERVQVEPKLSTDPRQAVQQLQQALHGLLLFGQEVGKFRNQLLGQAFSHQDDGFKAAIIDVANSNVVTSTEQLVKLADAPISGWDFTATVADNNGQQIFDSEFVERVAYLLGAVAQEDFDASIHAALLSVDRLDLLLTLARSEAQRLAEVLRQLPPEH